jgi:ketosteroid isomerase-like protein
MRRLFVAVAVAIAVAVGVLVGALAASGGSSASSASELQMQRNAELWEIGQLEKKFHRATTRKDLGLMMSLYAPNATFTFPGTTAVGKREIREFWRTSRSFTNDWLSETLAYKVRITLNGDRGTLYFECHYFDLKTGEMAAVTAADAEVARIGGRWLITGIGGASATLSP